MIHDTNACWILGKMAWLRSGAGVELGVNVPDVMVDGVVPKRGVKPKCRSGNRSELGLERIVGMKGLEIPTFGRISGSFWEVR